MPRRRAWSAWAAAVLAVALAPASVAAAEAPAAGTPARTLEIREFQIDGASSLPAIEVERAVYPFLGPWRDLQDVERARQALEQAYSDKGFQSVAVSIPQQTVREGVVRLVVTEGTVGRLRVHGARFFSPRDVRGQAPSVAEGTVPNFNALVKDLVALNMIPDRRVMPALRAGVVPGTVDVDLNVQDTLPLHGSLEVNDRHSASTVANRVTAALRYDNLFQLGHSLGLSVQLAPERLRDGKVFSGSYLARFPDPSWLTLSLNGVIQRSDVTTDGGIGVLGRGRIFGGRASFTLPSEGALFHTLGLGVDYKHFDEGLTMGEGSLKTPLTYWPATAQYGATWSAEGSQTQLGLSAIFDLRGLGSDAAQFDQKRYGASANFIYYRAELSRTDELPLKLQTFARVLGQYSPDALTRGCAVGLSLNPCFVDAGLPLPAGAGAEPPTRGPGESLIGSEQLTAGGADSVRGYLESQVAGDLGAVGTLEVRSPSFAWWIVKEWRLLAFVDGAWLGIHEALPEQKKVFRLLGVGGGTRISIRDLLHAAVDVGVPLAAEGTTRRFDPRIHFRAWTEF